MTPDSSIVLKSKNYAPTYIGIGASAILPDSVLIAPRVNEIDDPNPLVILLETDTDTLRSEIIARRDTVTDIIRVIFVVDSTKLLANYELKQDSTNPYFYRYNTPYVSEATFRVGDTAVLETIQYQAFMQYFTSAQQLNSLFKQLNFNATACEVCIPHDLVCTSIEGFGSINVIYLPMLFPPFVYSIDLRDCCFEHDVNLWCAKSEWEIFTSHNKMYTCMWDKIVTRAYEVGNNWVPLFGGLANGAFVIASPPTHIFLTAVRTAVGVASIWRPDGYYGGGVALNSCLCGGEQKTVHCSNPSRVLCEGDKDAVVTPEIYITRICGCNEGIVELEVRPNYVGATYSWSGVNASISVDPNDNSRAIATFSANASVSVTVETPCLQDPVTLTVNLSNTRPTPPNLKKLNLSTNCYGGSNSRVVIEIDDDDYCADNTYTFTAETGTIASTGVSSVEVIPEPLPTPVPGYNFIRSSLTCISVTAENSCGISEPTEICFMLTDCTVPMDPFLIDPDRFPPSPLSKTPLTVEEAQTMQLYLVLYPNPAKEEVYLDLPNIKGVHGMVIFDITGKIIHEQEVVGGRNSINVSQISNGSYFVHCTIGNNSFVLPLTIRR